MTERRGNLYQSVTISFDMVAKIFFFFSGNPQKKWKHFTQLFENRIFYVIFALQKKIKSDQEKAINQPIFIKTIIKNKYHSFKLKMKNNVK